MSTMSTRENDQKDSLSSMVIRGQSWVANRVPYIDISLPDGDQAAVGRQKKNNLRTGEQCTISIVVSSFISGRKNTKSPLPCALSPY